MNTFIIILIILVCLLLVAVVLVQNSKGGGLAANFASGNQAFGVRKTADILEQATWILTIALFLFCFSATVIYESNSHVQKSSAARKGIEGMQSQPNFKTPGQETGVPATPTAPATQPADSSNQ